VTRARSGMKSSKVPRVTVETVTWSAPTVWLDPAARTTRTGNGGEQDQHRTDRELDPVESFRVSTTWSIPLPVTGRSAALLFFASERLPCSWLSNPRAKHRATAECRAAHRIAPAQPFEFGHFCPESNARRNDAKPSRSERVAAGAVEGEIERGGPCHAQNPQRGAPCSEPAAAPFALIFRIGRNTAFSPLSRSRERRAGAVPIAKIRHFAVPFITGPAWHAN
jgi:hypothetical protein